MAVTIMNVNNTTFSINGIEYLKNFMSIVEGDNVKILNVYDSKVILQEPTIYSDYTVDGGGYASAALLQSALKDVLFNRDNLGTDLGYHIINNISDFNALVTGGTPGVWLFLANITLDANKTIPADVTFEFRNTKIDLNAFILTGTNTKINNIISQVFTTNGSFSGTWDVPRVFPEWFGAVGDGVTDDGAAFQEAIDFLGFNKTLYLSDKVYIIDTPLTINHIFNIVGVNTKTNTTGCVIRTNLTTGVLITNNYPELQLRGIQFFGSSTARGEDVSIVCLKTTGNLLSNNSDTQISNCSFYKFNKVLEIEGRNVLVMDSIFTGSAYAIYVNKTGVTDFRGLELYNNRFHSCGSATSIAPVIYINPASNYSDVIIDGYCDDCGDFYEGFSSETTIHNMLVTKLHQSFCNIDATGHALSFNKRNLHISNNKVHIFDPVTETSKSLIKTAGAYNGEITNNFLNRSGGHAIECDVRHTKIANNTILNPGLRTNNTYYGILITSTGFSSFITGNYIKQDVIIAENPNSAKAAIRLEAVSCMLRDNLTQGFTGTELELSATTITYFGEDPASLRRIAYASSVPTSGTWTKGDIVYNTNPSKDGNNMTVLGWLRLSSGAASGSAFWSIMNVSDVSPAT